MKLNLLLFVSLLGAAGVASAGPIVCGSFNYLGGTGTSGSALNCAAGAATAGPGQFINAITITVTSDYTGYLSGGSAGESAGTGPLESISYTFGGSAPFLYGPLSQDVLTTCGPANPNTGIFTCNSIAKTDHETITNLDTSLTSSPLITILGSAAISNGAVVSGSSVVLLNYTTSPTGFAPPTPEPATLGLVGATLIGLGLLNRRRS
jgi:hypothetical protein